MINKRLRELRKSLKLTQKDFGARIGFSQTHIASLETGERQITSRISADISRVFGVSEDWLMNGNPPMYNDLLKELDISEDIRQLAKQYIALNDKDRLLVKQLIDSLAEKN